MIEIKLSIQNPPPDFTLAGLAEAMLSVGLELYWCPVSGGFVAWPSDTPPPDDAKLIPL